MDSTIKNVIKAFITNCDKLRHLENNFERTICHSLIFNYNLIFNEKIGIISQGLICKHSKKCGYCIGFIMILHLFKEKVKAYANVDYTAGCLFVHTKEEYINMRKDVVEAMEGLDDEELLDIFKEKLDLKTKHFYNFGEVKSLKTVENTNRIQPILKEEEYFVGEYHILGLDNEVGDGVKQDEVKITVQKLGDAIFLPKDNSDKDETPDEDETSDEGETSDDITEDKN